MVETIQVLDQGICGCLDYDLTQGDDYLAVLPYLLDVGAIIEGLDEDIQRQVVSFLCSAVTNYGEHSQVWVAGCREKPLVPRCHGTEHAE